MSEFSDRMRARGEALKTRGENLFVTLRARGGVVDFAADLYDRDKESHGSVLGSAIALRLFLFVITANVALMGLVGVLRLGSFVEDDAGASATTGAVSEAMVGISWWNSLWFFLSGLVLTLMAGRSLAKVLAACAGGAWQMTVRESKVKSLAIVSLTGVLIADVASSIVFAHVREAGGLPAATVAWVAVLASTAVAWFLVMSALPRKVSDPGALLPGMLLMGVGFTMLQWFMQFYLPGRIARTTDTFGELAVTVATLGNFFFIGRLMASTFVLTAVIYERWGSVSQLVFGLPGVRRIAARSPKLRAFFSLDPADERADDEAAADEPAADGAAAEPVDPFAGL
jgi:hypothetical protein